VIVPSHRGAAELLSLVTRTPAIRFKIFSIGWRTAEAALQEFSKWRAMLARVTSINNERSFAFPIPWERHTPHHEEAANK
jgi:hypothetical protein